MFEEENENRLEKGARIIYPVTGLHLAIPNRFHHTPFLITHVSDPIGLPGRHEHVCSESVDVAVKLFSLVDFEPFRVFDLACLAVVVAVFAIDRRVHLRENEPSGFGDGVSGGARSEEGFPLLKDGGEGHLLLGGYCNSRTTTVEVGRRARHIFVAELRGNRRLLFGGIA